MNNPNVTITNTEILSKNWYILKKVTFDFKKKDGSVITQVREAYDRGNGAVIFLYNKQTKNIILTSQFRLPSYLNGNKTGMLIEACAGLLDEDNAEDCIRRETEEETGYKISDVKKIFEAYMSPGSVTEILHFFIAEYSKDMKVNEGGGAEGEEENIEVLELPFDQAYDIDCNRRNKRCQNHDVASVCQNKQPFRCLTQFGCCQKRKVYLCLENEHDETHDYSRENCITSKKPTPF